MFRRLYLLLILIFFSSGMQAQTAELRIMSLINFPDTALEGVSYPIGVVINNVGTAPYQGPLQVLIQGDTVPDILAFTNSPTFALMPGDSMALFSNANGMQGYTFTNALFRAGNDIVVIWPYSSQSGVILDSIQTGMYFVPLASVNTYAAESFNIYPNPFNSILKMDIPEGEFVEQVRIWNADGQLVSLLSQPGKEIDTNNFSEGFYIVSVTTNRRTISLKLVK